MIECTICNKKILESSSIKITERDKNNIWNFQIGTISCIICAVKVHEKLNPEYRKKETLK